MQVLEVPGSLSAFNGWLPAERLLAGAGTLLGLLAIVEIRQLRGRMWGAVPAVFAALLLPLLILNHALATVFWGLGRAWVGALRFGEYAPDFWITDPQGTWVALAALVTTVLIDVGIVTFTYRTARAR